MEVIIRKDAASAIDLTAEILADAITAKPDMVLGLATGRTMENLYDNLVKRHENKGLDFSLCKSFNLDEYIGLAGDDENSYRFYMNKFLFNRVNIDVRNTHLPAGDTADLDGEGERYEQAIVDAGGVDIQLLGIGRTGHIGFNEPLSSLMSRTRQKALAPVTIEQNSPLFDNPEDMPKRAFTMGVGTILDSEKVIMLVTGKEKAQILAKAVEGPVTAMISATALQLHPNTIVVCDEEAAELLTEKDYYKWIFDNEPEWAKYHHLG